MENIFFLVLIAIVGLVRWLAQMAENKKNAEAERRSAEPSKASAETLLPRAPAQTEEERVRRFLEALGVPTSASPPPKVQPPEALPKSPPAKRKILPVDPFPILQAKRVEQRPPVTPSPSIPIPPPIVPPPLPPREATVLAESDQKRERAFAHVSDFEVQDLEEGVAEDFLSHSGRSTGTPAKSKVPAASAIIRLGTEQGLRDAMVLREIFGPPRSLQDN